MKRISFLMLLLLMAVVGIQAKDKKVYTLWDGDRLLTYLYDDQYDSRVGTVEIYDPLYNMIRFTSYYQQVKKIEIDESMKNAPLTNMKYMFYGGNEPGKSYELSNVTTIKGLEYLNTQNVVFAMQAFYGLASVTELNLMSFDMSKVSNAQYMFSGCVNLETIYCGQDWSRLTQMESTEGMFYSCNKLKGGNGTAWTSAGSGSKAYARPEYNGCKEEGYFSYPKWDGDLSKVTSHVYAESGTIITGTFSPTGHTSYKINILPGCQVTLDNVNIPEAGYALTNDHAAINCMGDADITLKGNNIVHSYDFGQPAIFVPENCNLLIFEDKNEGGSLKATGRYGAAGIGGAEDVNCGYIYIYGGTIEAEGGQNGGAGIGSAADATCQSIHIFEGTVKATGGAGAAGIGSGLQGDVTEGGVRIYNTVTKVTAIAGEGACSVGAGKNGDCINVKVGEKEPGNITLPVFIYEPAAWNALEAEWDDLTALLDYATDNLYNTIATTIEGYLDAALPVYSNILSDPDLLYATANTAHENLESAVNAVLSAKEDEFMESLDDMLFDGASEDVQQIVVDAKQAIYLWLWDYDLTAEENLAKLENDFDEAWFAGVFQAITDQIAREKEGIEELILNGEKHKVMIDGQMYIIRQGKIYDAKGAMIQLLTPKTTQQ